VSDLFPGPAWPSRTFFGPGKRDLTAHVRRGRGRRRAACAAGLTGPRGLRCRRAWCSPRPGERREDPGAAHSGRSRPLTLQLFAVQIGRELEGTRSGRSGRPAGRRPSALPGQHRHRRAGMGRPGNPAGQHRHGELRRLHGRASISCPRHPGPGRHAEVRRARQLDKAETPETNTPC